MYKLISYLLYLPFAHLWHRLFIMRERQRKSLSLHAGRHWWVFEYSVLDGDGGLSRHSSKNLFREILPQGKIQSDGCSDKSQSRVHKISSLRRVHNSSRFFQSVTDPFLYIHLQIHPSLKVLSVFRVYHRKLNSFNLW